MNQNTKRKLERLAKFIEKLPKSRFYMNTWGSGYSCVVADECGTHHCIGGWALARKGYTVSRWTATDASGKGVDPREKAQEILGLSNGEADLLFFAENWPYKPNTSTKMFLDTPKGAAARIRYLIKEGK
jgi:hypothetical protein